MANESIGGSSIVTSLTQKKDPGEHALMRFTAVTSHQPMAQAFLDELVRVGQAMMPDHKLSISDVFSICRVALEQKGPGVVMLEGRHIRSRINEQLSRADRYNEPFTVFVIHFDHSDDPNTYEAMVDTLCERMRKTDLMFLFKTRIVLILPHTDGAASACLSKRIIGLLDEAINPKINARISSLTYPDPDVTSAMNVLDWVEDQLRS